MYIISKCLLGYDCKYNGGNNLNRNVVEFAKSHVCTLICPETAGGLMSPRPPAEQVATEDGSFRVIDNNGKDVTDAFRNGAEESIESSLEDAISKGELIEGAILKARSPSCGCNIIYDGSFTGTKTSGNGVFTARLIEESQNNSSLFAKDFRIMTEEDL